VIVFDDADLSSAVSGLKAFGYYNAGQDCTAACRVYAGKKVYDNLVADLSSAAKELKYNLPNDDENEQSPVRRYWLSRHRLAATVSGSILCSCHHSRSLPVAWFC
jgi:Aldehyde dehydrogenase family